MIKKKFLCYQTTQEFQKELNLIPDTSIVFVLDKGYIYTHGTYIFDPAIQETITKVLGYLEERINDNEKTLSAVLNDFPRSVDVEKSLDQKVDKISGKSLVSDSEISKLSGLPTKATLDGSISQAKKAGTDAQGEISTHKSNKSNPHGVTKGQVGLGNVDNTSDLSKPISTATQAALDLKVDKVNGKELISTTNLNKLAGIEEGAEKNTVLSVVGMKGNISEEDLGIDISSKALGSLESRIEMLEETMGTVINELQMEIQKLKE